MSYLLDPFTADTLRAMVRTSRWSDDRIARYLGIDAKHVRAARDRMPLKAGGTGFRARISQLNRSAAA